MRAVTLLSSNTMNVYFSKFHILIAVLAGCKIDKCLIEMAVSIEFTSGSTLYCDAKISHLTLEYENTVPFRILLLLCRYVCYLVV